MAPDKMIMLEIGGQAVTVMVEREQLEELAADGYPADRSVHVITWNDHQIDDTRLSDRLQSDKSEWVWPSPRSAARRLVRAAGTASASRPARYAGRSPLAACSMTSAVVAPIPGSARSVPFPIRRSSSPGASSPTTCAARRKARTR